MDIVIHNAEEAIEACLPHIDWRHAYGYGVLESDAILTARSGLPPDVPLHIRAKCVYKVEEVPCGWCIFWGVPELAKQMRETGKADDSLKLLGGWPFLVNRWTGKADTVTKLILPTWNAAVQNYIYHLPEDQLAACRLPEFRNIWKPDPIRFWPPELRVEVDKVDDLENIRFALEIDEEGQDLLVGGELNFAGMAPFHGQPPFLRACSVVEVKQEGATKIYTLKPEFDMARLRLHGGFGDRISLSICETEIFPDGVGLYFQVRVGN